VTDDCSRFIKLSIHIFCIRLQFMQSIRMTDGCSLFKYTKIDPNCDVIQHIVYISMHPKRSNWFRIILKLLQFSFPLYTDLGLSIYACYESMVENCVFCVGMSKLVKIYNFVFLIETYKINNNN